MATLEIPGVPDPNPDRPELARGLPPGAVEPRGTVFVRAARAGGPRLRLEGLQPDDIAEIELDDGLRLWSRLDDLQRDYALGSSRDAAGDAIVLPAELQLGGPSRGVGGWAIKSVKVFGIEIDRTIADFVAERVEGQLQPGPGLYRCSEGSAAALVPVGTLTGTGPTLVLLHGTASSTAGSFGGLWTGDGGRHSAALFAYYEGRVLAYQHETLTRSPIENAAALVERLLELAGTGAEIHLVSHSRGGLVGELLARGMRRGAAPFSPAEIALFGGSARARDREAIARLNKALQRGGLRVTRFVRVACPARGTTLADGRLDRYFSILVNAAALVPGLRTNPVYDGLTALLAGVLKRRADPSDLPGLEAMMPASPLVQMLNTPGIRTDADLHVLGGDLEGTGLFGRLKTLATDLYYRDDHDLVVNTPAMLGGTERTAPIRYWIDTGGDVTHFNYFVRADTAARLVTALTGGKADFRELEVAPFAVSAEDYRKRAAGPQPVVFVLPGIMGSELSAGGRRIWMDVFALARGGLTELRSAAAGVEARGVVRSAYADVCRFLAASHEVVPFPYDWRHSVEAAGARLRAAIDDTLERVEAAGQPVRILAHSMGGLVVRALLATAAGQKTWQRMCRQPGARVVMLGTPTAGSHAIAALLMGRDDLVKKLALLDLQHDYKGLLDTITSFDGVLDLLPYDGTVDLFTLEAWHRVHASDVPSARGIFSSSVASSKSAGFAWPIPAAAALARARRVRELMRETPLDPARVVYVAGAAPETACDLVLDETAPPGRRVRILATAHGDGRVPWKTGIPPGVRTYYMDVVHGDMARQQEHFPALLDLLTTGTTSKLPTVAPRRRAGAEETFELRESMPAMVPDEEELVASALGGRRARVTRADRRARVTVRIVHDSLSNATAPVLIGHYDKDLIVGAEKYLDRQLSGRLSDLQRMGLYAGPLDTAVVVVNDDESGRLARHPGAVVAGLGMVGELTPGRLTRTLAQALTSYGAECVGRERRRRQRLGLPETGGPISTPLCALLVGSGEAGVTLADSLQALLSAVAQANQRLRLPAEGDEAAGQALTAVIDDVDVFELYEDRAIEAVHALRVAMRSEELRGFVADDLLGVGAGGQHRARFDAAQEWWQRIRVSRQPSGELLFEALTQLARVQATLQPAQWRIVDALVDQAIAITAHDPSFGYTLFEMLVPDGFKSQAPDRRKLVLVLDEHAAALPWELLQDRFDKTARPLSVASGMVRQLVVLEGREHVARAPGNTALVIGDPVVTDRRMFPALPGATEEAQIVAARLSAEGYQVTEMIGEMADPLAVLTALHQSPWRVLHVAAHGVFRFVPEEGAEPVSGLVLDNGTFLTAGEAEQMRHTPELVFINCCHLGQARGDAQRAGTVAYHRLAANLATQFIRMGARAVVAAGWEVDDAAAKTFAREFYEALFDGRPFGDAVLRARERTFAAHGGANTWGAYQCYGDPAFSLVKATPEMRSEAPAAIPEVLAWADGLTARARTADDQERTTLLADLESGVATIPQAWWPSPRLCACIAAAYGELGEFAKAVRYYDTVITAEAADVPLRALEQLANLKVRWASALAGAPGGVRRAMRRLAEAEKLLRQLLAIGATAERWSLLGSLYKRRAQLAPTTAARRAALEQMKTAYGEACTIAERTRPADRAYALANRLAAEVVLSWRSAPAKARRERAASVSTGLDELGRVAAELARGSTGYFQLAAGADHLLLTALATRRLTEADRAHVAAAFHDAGLRGVSPRHRASMLDHLAFFATIASRELKGKEGTTLVRQLGLLREAL